MNNPLFTLLFVSENEVSLFSSEFKCIGSKQSYKSIRGKTEGAFSGYGTFQWTSAIKALCILCLRYRLSNEDPSTEARILGGNGSLASSLDYAISKVPNWIAEMFGTNQSGIIAAKRIFLRTNPNRKRPGPVVISINKRMISPGNIKIVWNDMVINDVATLRDLLNEIQKVEIYIDNKSCGSMGRAVNNELFQ